MTDESDQKSLGYAPENMVARWVCYFSWASLVVQYTKNLGFRCGPEHFFFLFVDTGDDDDDEDDEDCSVGLKI